MIQIRNLTKRYGGTVALREVSLDLLPGEIHAVCGENGAGKSTLNRILAGLVSPDEGDVIWEGGAPSPPSPSGADRASTTRLRLGSVPSAEAAGIAMVHQESAAFLHLTAVENHQIMREPGSALWLDRTTMRERTQESLAELGESIDLDAPLASLSNAQRHMVAIARALATKCRLLILDEPTAMLSVRECEMLFRAVRRLRDEGTTVLYVSHRLDEVFALADRVTVLRDGRLVATHPIGEVTRADLMRMMAGAEVASSQVNLAVAQGLVVLSVENITRHGAFQTVSFQLHQGEVVVLAGLVGAGRSEVARAIFGLDPTDSGRILGDAKLALVPEDRQHEGLHVPMSIRDNLAMAQLRPAWRNRRAEQQSANELISALSIKAASDEAPVASLSGGNQQKVLVGKWLATEPEVLILDEPTRGVDVMAKAQIHDLIRDLTHQGKAILVVSSDMAEVLELGDRILVMREGRIAGEVPRADATQERILELALPADDASADYHTAAKKPRRRELGVGALLGVMVIAASLANPDFLSAANLTDVLVKVAPAIIVGSMMTLVILAREIDISIGSLMGLCAATLGVACSTDRLGLPVPMGVALCLGVGLVAGVVNGVLVAKARIPSIIVTLGMLTVFRGITERLMAGKWIENLPDGLREFGTGRLLGVPHGVTMAAVAVLAGLWITRRTRFGLHTFAIGSNPQAAEMRGVPADRVRIALFALSGLAAAVAALFSATQLQVVESGFGTGFELVVIAAVVVGGTSIRGGEGSILGTVLGALLLGTISTALIFLRLGDSAVYWERAIQGGLILLAVVGDSLLRRRSAR
jgi:ABC-type sugar transport system ATPase subunit/ribose/xylose/arabinose/galactoside ABC-type transport system permease subunit